MTKIWLFYITNINKEVKYTNQNYNAQELKNMIEESMNNMEEEIENNDNDNESNEDEEEYCYRFYMLWRSYMSFTWSH